MHKSRVLIYRLGSLGDTVVALPAFHLIAHAFPTAERWVLTDFHRDAKATPLEQVLSNTDLVQGYIHYPLHLRAPLRLVQLRKEIQHLHADLLIYLAASRGAVKLFRDLMFFRWCGIHRFIGAPRTRDLRNPRALTDGTFESEGSRLLRCLHQLGESSIEAAGAFDLELTPHERAAAKNALAELPADIPILAVSIGAKVDVKDWGDPHWSTFLTRLRTHLPGWSLIFLGAPVERERSQQLLSLWSGPTKNLCGTLSVRTSAAVLEHARAFVGHDSGPMHLAASVGTPCVGIFSSRNLPGTWFPHGGHHRVIYNDVSCRGCELDVCVSQGKRCILGISPDEVITTLEDLLFRNDEAQETAGKLQTRRDARSRRGS